MSIVAGCSGSDGPAAPTQCNQDERNGVYLLHAVAVSGNCGDIPDELVNTSAGGTGNCTSSGVVWSNSDCKLSFTNTCNGGMETVTAVTVQQTQDGSVLKGIETIDVELSNASCTGTYDVTFTRQ